MRFNRKSLHNNLCLWFLVGIILSACNRKLTPSATQPAVEITPTVMPAQTALPLRELTICTADEPDNLYLYGGFANRAKWNIFEAIYDGPIDVIDGQPVPVIVESIPSLENGGLVLLPAEVVAGQPIVDARGELAVLSAGVSVRPSGCQSSACAIIWDGSSPLNMDRMQLSFTFIENLRWSDGQPLTASDSLFSFTQSKIEPGTQQQWALDRTTDYQAPDATHVVWQGLPGFTTSNISPFLWLPLPQHQLGNLTREEFLAQGSAVTLPLSWGAYRVDGWAVGEQILLSANPAYFRAAEGLPAYDRLVFKFIPNADDALQAWKQGDCQVLDESYHLENGMDQILQDPAIDQADLHIIKGPSWSGLVFGITPAAYDDGYTPQYGDRERFFDDVRTRQAFAQCIDRQMIVDKLTWGLSEVPSDIFDFPGIGVPLAYDQEAGKALLEQAGWKDFEGDALTTRQAWGVAGVTNGTLLQLNLFTTTGGFNQQAATLISESLAGCGVELTLVTYPPEELFAPGPQGVLFGRQFDMALFAWAGRDQNTCAPYQGWQIPRQSNYWVGTNLGGFDEWVYDQACSDVSLSIDPGSLSTQLEALSNATPVIPVAYDLRVILVHSDIGFQVLDHNLRSAFSAIESAN